MKVEARHGGFHRAWPTRKAIEVNALALPELLLA
jgi:hypothetical protein